MKKITESKAKPKFQIPEGSINYISSPDLKKYLEVTDRFISDETKELVNWLIVNNDSYISDLSNDEDENALAGFYKAGVPDKENLRELYRLLDTIIKAGKTIKCLL